MKMSERVLVSLMVALAVGSLSGLSCAEVLYANDDCFVDSGINQDDNGILVKTVGNRNGWIEFPLGNTEVAVATPGLQLAGPNPFNPTTRFSYTLAQPGQVLIAVYDVAGRRVATLVDAYSPQGQFSVEWSARNVASGR